jgi:hypothetical protein
LNLIFCPNLEIGTGRYHRGDHTTSSRNVEHVFNLEKKRHRRFCESVSIARSHVYSDMSKRLLL